MSTGAPTPGEVKEAIEFGKKLWGYWQQIRVALGGRKAEILFTGMEGVGKTALYDYLSGEGYKRGYQPPSRSLKPELGRIKNSQKKTDAILVVPGQESHPRSVAITDTLASTSPPDGIVHVVANGLATVREDSSTELLTLTKRQKTLSGLRAVLRERELTDLRDVCSLIRQAHRTHRKPSWLILVVTKYDLFPTDPDIQARYFPGGKDDYVESLDRLTRQVGSDNFRWQSAIVCSYLESLTWKQETLNSGIQPSQRDTMIEELAKLILALSQERSK